MSSVVALIRACHPGPTAAVTTHCGSARHLVGALRSLLVVVGATVLVGQLSIGWSNDWLDAERDAAAGRLDKPTTPWVSRTVDAALVSAVGRGPVGSAVAPHRVERVWHLLLVASGWAYNLGLKKTAWSPVPYAVGFGALRST